MKIKKAVVLSLFAFALSMMIDVSPVQALTAGSPFSPAPFAVSGSSNNNSTRTCPGGTRLVGVRCVTDCPNNTWLVAGKCVGLSTVRNNPGVACAVGERFDRLTGRLCPSSTQGNESSTPQGSSSGRSGSSGQPSNTLITQAILPTIILGQTSTGASLPCDSVGVNLSWTPVAGSVYHNIRVDDTTANAWGNKAGGLTWCAGYDGGGDLCENSLLANSRKAYPVTPGHSYRFWVDYTDAAGAAVATSSMTFSVPVCSTPYVSSDTDPVVSLVSGASSAPVLACSVRNVKLVWSSPAGTVYNNIRVDDQTANGWGGKVGGNSWCDTYNGDGDLCQNGLPASMTSTSYPVRAGHTYHFWIDSTDAKGTAVATSSMTFSVPVCPPAPTVDLKIATSSDSGPYFDRVSVSASIPGWLKWSSTNSTSCTRSADPAATYWPGTSGSTATSGVSVTGALDMNRRYSISCMGPGGSVSDSVEVERVVVVAVSTSTLSYSGNGSTDGVAPASVDYASDATVTVSDNTGSLIKTGYRFAGWNTAADGSGTARAVGSTFVMGVANITLYAQWTAITTQRTVSCIFDAVKYANYYSDLKTAFGSDEAKLTNHWLNFGINEGRTPCGAEMISCKFDGPTYVKLYPDLIAAKVDGKTHYTKFGVKEGRAICQKVIMSTVSADDQVASPVAADSLWQKILNLFR